MKDKISIRTSNSTETEQLGFDIGKKLHGGEVIELKSDLGGGKTTFTRGLTRGAGSQDHVSSPTFTVSKVYRAPNFDIHHFDFYRLQEAGLMEHEIAELLDDTNVVVVVEWGQVIQHVLPAERISIEIDQVDTESRDIHITIHPTLEYILEEL